MNVDKIQEESGTEIPASLNTQDQIDQCERFKVSLRQMCLEIEQKDAELLSILKDDDLARKVKLVGDISKLCSKLNSLLDQIRKNTILKPNDLIYDQTLAEKIFASFNAIEISQKRAEINISRQQVSQADFTTCTKMIHEFCEPHVSGTGVGKRDWYVFDRLPEHLDREKQILQLFQSLDITTEVEQEAIAASIDKPLSNAVKVSLVRSFKNIRAAVAAQARSGWGINSEQFLSEIEKIKQSRCMVMNMKPNNAVKFLKSGILKNIWEVGANDRPREIEPRRQQYETELGWQGEFVYHLAVGDYHNEHDLALKGHYGNVEFVFDFELLAENATFTEGDSLNYSGVPAYIRENMPTDQTEIRYRELHKDHVAIAKAIFNTANCQGGNHDYIEAQIGSPITNAMIKKVIIRADLTPQGEDSAVQLIREWCLSRDIPVEMI